MLPSPPDLALPEPAPAVVLTGTVSCEGCPPGPIWVQAWAGVDRYNWPWWNVYGFLEGFHTPAELDALRPQPLARIKLDAPGPFRLALPGPAEAHVFALLDAGGEGADRGPAPPDWIGRFPRNPAGAASGPLSIVLYPLIWSKDFAARRYRSPPAPDGAPRFVDATAASGIDFRHCQGGDLGQIPNVVGSGAALEDLDGDGDLDLFAVQGMGECAGASATARLWLNDGKGSFRDATESSGAGLRAVGMGAIAGDVDHDGDIDLYVTTFRGGRLLRNAGRARFADVTAELGLANPEEWTVGGSFGDVDGDGRLDLYVTNYVDFSTAPPFVPDAEVPAFVTPMLSSPFAFPPRPKRLFLGTAGGRFREAPAALGAADPDGKGMASTLADLDRDGDLDLFVTNDCTRDALFENRGGRFVPVGRAARVDDLASGMGIALGDLDGDGLPDLHSPHWLNEPVALYRNVSRPGELRFEDRTVEWGLGPTGNGRTGWASLFLDADLDGDLDLFVTTGHTHPGRDPKSLEGQPLELFVNDGTGRLRDVSSASGQALLDERVWRGAAAGDVDGDGDVDLFVMAWNGPARLLRNETRGAGWLKVRLLRKNGERGGIGSRIELRAGGRLQVRDVATGTGYLSHSALEQVFGLGRAARIDLLEVVWPGGARERFPAPGINRVLTLREGSTSRTPERP